MKPSPNAALGAGVLLAIGAVMLATLAVAAPAAAPPSRPMSLVTVRGQTACGTTGRMLVEATVDGGAGGKGTVFVRSSRGAVSSAPFVAEPHQRVTVAVRVSDVTCASPGAFDVWLGAGGAHKGLVPATVTFVEGTPVEGTPAGSSSMVGNAVGGG